MPVYILKRLFQALFVVIAVTLLVSYAIRLSGDPTAMLAAVAGPSAKRICSASVPVLVSISRSICNI